MSDHHHNPDEKPGWADTDGFRKVFLGVLILACFGAAIAGFIPEFQKKHPHFAAEGFPVFFALWGFGAFIFIVEIGQHLRKLVGRKEEYYDERE